MAADTVRFGVIGLGGMGSFHVNYLHEIDGAVISAVSDIDPKRVDQVATNLAATAAKSGANAARVAPADRLGKFTTYQDVLNSGLVDAVLIATPHYQHPEISIAAFDKGVHVLSEKPLAVHVKDARRALEAHAKRPDLKFAVNFQMRTSPLFKKVRSLVEDGELGELSRVTWIVTNWFRTWAYYGSGGWRATWAGEGGGVLINQCPHNLDLLPWLTGMMPSRITAVASIGKTHPIEVEDEVSAILEYPNGAVGHFVTTTGEAPGTDRLELCGDRGKLVVENGKIQFARTRKSVREVRETSKESFAQVETWEFEVPVKGAADATHKALTQNFVNAILKNEPLAAPAAEGVRGLEIGNAMLMAGVTRKPVDLPLDGDAYERLLADLQKQYGGKKSLKTEAAVVDMKASFH